MVIAHDLVTANSTHGVFIDRPMNIAKIVISRLTSGFLFGCAENHEEIKDKAASFLDTPVSLQFDQLT